MTTLTIVLFCAGVLMLGAAGVAWAVVRHRRQVIAERTAVTYSALRTRTPKVIVLLNNDGQGEMSEKLTDLWVRISPALEADSHDCTKLARLLDQLEKILNDAKSPELASRQQRRVRLQEVFKTHSAPLLEHLDKLDAASDETDDLGNPGSKPPTTKVGRESQATVVH